MSKKFSKGLLSFIVSSLLVCSFVFPSFAVTDESSPTPEILIPGICEARIEVDFPTYSNNALSNFKIMRPDDEKSYILVNSDGSFYAPNYTNNLNRFIISKPGYLTRTVDLRIGRAVNPIVMWAGDLNKDNSINIADIMLIAQNFNTVSTDAGYNSLMDFNMDNSVNIVDIMILASHFAKSSEDYPQFDPNIGY